MSSKPFFTPAQKGTLKGICDELLTCIAKTRSLPGGLDVDAASPLINRILDVRNEISPPTKTNPTNTTNGHAKP